MGTMNVYIATPVNGRTEATLEAKQAAALARVEYLERCYKAVYGSDVTCWSSFDLMYPREVREMSEGEIMGQCVRVIIDKIDVIFIDQGWTDSKGCSVEAMTAYQYGKKCEYWQEFKEKYAIQLRMAGIITKKPFEQECAEGKFEFDPTRSFEERCEIVRQTALTADMTYEERLAALKRRFGL